MTYVAAVSELVNKMSIFQFRRRACVSIWARRIVQLVNIFLFFQFCESAGVHVGRWGRPVGQHLLAFPFSPFRSACLHAGGWRVAGVGHHFIDFPIQLLRLRGTLVAGDRRWQNDFVFNRSATASTAFQRQRY